MQVNKAPMPCDLALLNFDNKRGRFQINNDDSGRMIVFEGKWASDNNTLIVDGITLGTVAGHPEKVHLTKATGMCPANQKVITCTAQTVTGQLYEVTLVQRTDGGGR
jgi:hypothetical protein